MTGVWGKSGVALTHRASGPVSRALRTAAARFSYTGAIPGQARRTAATPSMVVGSRSPSAPLPGSTVPRYRRRNQQCHRAREIRPHCGILTGQGPWMCCVGGCRLHRSPDQFPDLSWRKGCAGRGECGGSPSGCQQPVLLHDVGRLQVEARWRRTSCLCDGSVRFHWREHRLRDLPEARRPA